MRSRNSSDTYPKTGTVITYTPGGAGRMLAAQDTASGINYVQNAHYAPFGGLTSMTQDAAPITTTNAFNKRLQPLTLSAATGTSTILSLSYDFHLGAGDNGNVFQIVNNRDGNRTQSFIYDGLNRIQQASSAGPNWGEAFTIDAWGNLTGRGPVAGKSSYEFLSQAALTNNRLTGFGYDAAGNMTSNGGVSYSYDAENRLLTTAGVTYTYDGDGQRVKKSSGTLYWTGGGSDTLSETNLAGTTQKEYIYFNGKRVARRDVPGTPTVKYYFSDHLGSASVITNNTGTMPPLDESDYYPYGGEIAVSGSDSNHYKFTGKERDSESGLDNFGARYDSSNLGRFMTADPSPKGIAPLDPQSWNLYSYARNRPTRFVDIGGNWATDVHAQIVTYALQGYMSAGELDELRARQYVMDADQSDQNKHSMANQGQSSQDALNGMWSFVSSDMTIASQNVGADGTLNKAGLDALGDAMHAVQDFTSPMHTDSNFMPMAWNGGEWPPSKWGTGLSHLQGETFPSQGWARIGYAIRLTMAAYLQSGAGCEAGKKCLTTANFESELSKNVANYVHQFYAPGDSMRGTQWAVAEDAARQCALGNRAACDF